MQTNSNYKKRKYNNVPKYKKQRSRPKKKWAPIKRPISSEVKFVDTYFPYQNGFSYFAGAYTNTGYALNSLYKGTGAYQRLGNKINLKSLQIVGYIRKYAYDRVIQPTKLRILIVYDKQPNGDLPQIQQVIRGININGDALTNGQQMINQSYRDRFEIIKDIQRTVPGTAMIDNNPVLYDTQTEDSSRIVNCYIRLKGRPTIYSTDANAGSIGDIRSGALLIYLIDNNQASNGEWNFDCQMRLRYWDS